AARRLSATRWSAGPGPRAGAATDRAFLLRWAFRRPRGTVAARSRSAACRVARGPRERRRRDEAPARASQPRRPLPCRTQYHVPHSPRQSETRRGGRPLLVEIENEAVPVRVVLRRRNPASGGHTVDVLASMSRAVRPHANVNPE